MGAGHILNGDIVNVLWKLKSEGKSDYAVIDEGISKEAALLHFEMRKTQKDFGLSDAYVSAIARRTKSKILLGNFHFKDVKEAFFIK